MNQVGTSASRNIAHTIKKPSWKAALEDWIITVWPRKDDAAGMSCAFGSPDACRGPATSRRSSIVVRATLLQVTFPLGDTSM